MTFANLIWPIPDTSSKVGADRISCGGSRSDEILDEEMVEVLIELQGAEQWLNLANELLANWRDLASQLRGLKLIRLLREVVTNRALSSEHEEKLRVRFGDISDRFVESLRDRLSGSDELLAEQLVGDGINSIHTRMLAHAHTRHSLTPPTLVKSTYSPLSPSLPPSPTPHTRYCPV